MQSPLNRNGTGLLWIPVPPNRPLPCVRPHSLCFLSPAWPTARRRAPLRPSQSILDPLSPSQTLSVPPRPSQTLLVPLSPLLPTFPFTHQHRKGEQSAGWQERKVLNECLSFFLFFFLPLYYKSHTQKNNGYLKGFVVPRRTITYWRTILSLEAPW